MRRPTFHGYAAASVAAGWIAIIAGFAALAIRRTPAPEPALATVEIGG